MDELAQEKLSPLLRLKYNNAIADAVADLGRPDETGQLFAGFQKVFVSVAGPVEAVVMSAKPQR